MFFTSAVHLFILFLVALVNNEIAVGLFSLLPIHLFTQWKPSQGNQDLISMPQICCGLGCFLLLSWNITLHLKFHPLPLQSEHLSIRVSSFLCALWHWTLMTYFCITLYCFRNVQWIYRTAGSGWKLCSLFSLPQFFPSWLSFRKALGFLDLWKRLWGLLEQMPSKCKSLGFLRKMEYDCRIDVICAWSFQFYFTHLVSF